MNHFGTSLFEPEDDKQTEPNKKVPDAGKLCRFYFMIAVFIAVVLIFSLCVAYYVSNQEGLLSKTILRPELDTRNYKAIILSNSMKALLISDPEAESSAVGININVGSFNDPIEIPGLSHLLEHMLMKGSKKYPNSYEFSNYLEENHGEKNEITGSETTIFYFTIENNKLQNALEIFSRYFLEPLFNKDVFNQEIDQISQEYEQIIGKNDYKSQFLLKIMASGQHPFSRFNIGNLDTLRRGPEKQGLNSYLEMIDFHQSHYSANLMSLVITGKTSIEVLEEWAKNKFSLIKNNLIEKTDWRKAPKPFGFDQLGFIAKIQGKTMEDKLFVVFPVQEQLSKFKEKPLDYIDFLIKYRGKGSLVSMLRGKRLIFSLKTIIYEEASDFTLYGVEMTLTPAGFKDPAAVLEVFFAFLREVERNGVNEGTYEDLGKISKVLFRFREAKTPTEEIRELTRNLGVYPIHNVVSGAQIYQNYDPGTIGQTLKAMTVRNAIVILESPGFVYKKEGRNTNISLIEKTGLFYTKKNQIFLTKKTGLINSKARDYANESYFLKPELSGYSELYDLSFAFQKMDDSLISMFLNNSENEGFSLPKPNNFIPEKFMMIPQCQLSDIVSNQKSFLPATNNNTRTAGNETGSEGRNASIFLSKKTRDIYNDNSLNSSGANATFQKLSECSIFDVSNDVAQDYPEILYSTPRLTVWHKLDRSFKLPKAEIWLSWENPYVSLSAKEYQMSCFLVRFYALALSESLPEIYSNSMNTLEVSETIKGLLLHFSGFSDKIPQIFSSIFEVLGKTTINNEAFLNIQEEVIRDYRFEMIDFQPKKTLKAQLQKVLRTRFYRTKDLLETAPGISFQEIESFNGKFVSSGRLKALLIGNILNETALDVMDNGARQLNISSQQGDEGVFTEKILNISRKALLFYSERNSTKSDLVYLLNYYQFGPKEIGNLSKLFLIVNGLDAYSVGLLKIAESLDEEVDIGLHQESGIFGVSLFLVRSNRTAGEMDAEVEGLLGDYEKVLRKYSSEDFEKLKGLIISVLRETDRNLQEKAERYWNEVFSDSLDFDQKAKMRRVLEGLTLSDLIQFYRDFFKGKCGKISIAIGTGPEYGFEARGKGGNAGNYTELQGESWEIEREVEGVPRFDPQDGSKLL